MTVTREPDFFQDDLYPDTAGLELAFEAEYWMSRLECLSHPYLTKGSLCAQ